MEFYTLPSPAYPEDIREIALALWTDLSSAQDLRARLVAASTMPGDEGDCERAALDFAFLDGRAVRPNTSATFCSRPSQCCHLALTESSLEAQHRSAL